MTKIKNVFVMTAKPSKRLPLGALEEGFYTEEGDTVHLVTSTGRPRLGRDNKPLTRKLVAGEEPKTAAWRLTKENLPARKSDFNRPLYYPRRGKI